MATLSAIVNVNDTIYAFNAWTGEVVILDVMNGHTTVVSVGQNALPRISLPRFPPSGFATGGAAEDQRRRPD